MIDAGGLGLLQRSENSRQGGWEWPGDSREDCGGSKPQTQRAFQMILNFRGKSQDCWMCDNPHVLTSDHGLSLVDRETEAQEATEAPDRWVGPRVGVE